MEKGRKSISLRRDVYRRLTEAKEHYEADVKKKISYGSFIDVLVFAYNLFREKRGSSESLFLDEMISKKRQKKK